MNRYLYGLCLLAGSFLTLELNAESPPDPLFVERDILGFRVVIDRAALNKEPERTAEALEHMRQQLFQITLVVPAENVDELRRVPIWLASDQSKLGIAFHPDRGWLTSRGYQPPENRSQIGLQSGRLYLHESLRQPWLVFHELCHGFDYFTIGQLRGYGNAVKADHYKQAVKSGKYDSALHWNSRMRKPYHATNHMEFFAETSEAFFGTNDIFPFVRAELRDHDPATFRLLGQLWDVDTSAETAREQELVRRLAESTRLTSSGDPPRAGGQGKEYVKRRKYVQREIEGWQVLIHPQLGTDESKAAALIDRLQRDLHYAKRYLPESAVAQLQDVKIWVEHDSPSSGFVTYHSSRRWLRENSFRAAMRESIEIGNADAYLQHFSRQPSALLNALACAFHQRVLGYDNNDVRAIWEQAKETKQLATVLRFDGKRVPHPGLANDKLAFAELSETLYGTNDHYPFVRAELRYIAPELAKRLEALWQTKSSLQPESP